MNRIILVGNGFDLAHNLHTSYKNFIEWYWNGYGEKLKNSTKTYEESIFVNANITTSRHYSSWESYYEKRGCKSVLEFTKALRNDTSIFRYNSKFFESINKSIELKGWVDIENEYYNQLINNHSLDLLNTHLENLRDLLIQYLSEQQPLFGNCTIKKMQFDMLGPIHHNEVAISMKDRWMDFLKKRGNEQFNLEYYDYWMNLLQSYYNDDWATASFDGIRSFDKEFKQQIENFGIGSVPIEYFPDDYFLPDRILLLNFNYTNVADQYLPTADRFSTIHIHGELSKPDSVIFGYGDEMDEGYDVLKKKNDNKYLKHMKTPRYLENDNYRRMEDFAESGPFQIYIMGHSCGNSDRTLLNTLFEHPNCVSIKPFYYEDKKSGKDNYLDIVQNISRNFTDAKKMRDRVVNKMYCQPLPQMEEENAKK